MKTIELYRFSHNFFQILFLVCLQCFSYAFLMINQKFNNIAHNFLSALVPCFDQIGLIIPIKVLFQADFFLSANLKKKNKLFLAAFIRFISSISIELSFQYLKCKQKYDLSFVYIIKNFELCISLINRRTLKYR